MRAIVSIVGVFLFLSFASHLFSQDSIGGTAKDAGLAISNPDEYAWRLFAELSKPHLGKDGKPDGTVKWENWALARVIYGDPDSKPTWENSIKPVKERAKRFDSLPIQQRILREALEEAIGKKLSRRKQMRHSNPAAFDSNLAGIGDAEPENDEVRMNQSAFETVIAHELWNIDGQEKAFERGIPVAFEADAKEIKAEWRNITNLHPDEDRNKKMQNAYHTATFEKDGKTEVWGLVALHITTKDLPNWFWATWEHESTSQRESVVRSEDRWGAKLKVGDSEFDVIDLLDGIGKEKGDPYPNGKWVGPSSQLTKLLNNSGLTEEKWKHYVLRGTQVDFTDKFGRPTILANSVIEEGFQSTSSCITCHAKAGIGPRMRRSDEKNMLPVFKSSNPPVGDIGLPNPDWFFGERTEPRNRKYLQFDFVWSTIRAKRKGTGSSSSESSGATEHPLTGTWKYAALKVDAEAASAEILGNGDMTINVNQEDNSISGELAINMGAEGVWNLDLGGSAELKDGRWHLSFLGTGSSLQNNAASGNQWVYRYEGVVQQSPNKLTGRVVRHSDHLSTKAYKLTQEQPDLTIEEIIEKLDGAENVYNRKGVSGTFHMLRKD